MKTLSGLIVGLLVGAMFMVGIFLWDESPDSPSPVVDTAYVDTLLDGCNLWLVGETIRWVPGWCADSIAVLNARLTDGSR